MDTRWCARKNADPKRVDWGGGGVLHRMVKGMSAREDARPRKG